MRGAAKLGKADDLGKSLDLLFVPGYRIQQKVIGAHRDQLLELLTDLLRRAVNTVGIGLSRVMVDLCEPTVDLGAGDLWALVYRHEYPFGDRIRRKGASLLLQRAAQKYDARAETL